MKTTPTTEALKRMNMNVPKSLHDAFKAATAARGENMTNVLLEYVEQYVAKHGATPKKKKGGRQ